MSSLFALTIFATLLVLVHCQEFNHEETVDHHKYTDDKVCKKTEIGKNRRNGALQPRERQVVLKPEPGFEFFPRTVTVKRCNGHCPGLWTPMPTETETRSFTVHLHRSGESFPMKCVSVDVLEHTACKCMCMMTEESCKEKQYWDESNCECPCKGRKTLKAQCEAKPGMAWYDADCECRCAGKIMACHSGTMWDEDLCKCVSI